MPHKVEAVALTCIDYRFRGAIQEFFNQKLGLKHVDHIALGGGVKNLLIEGPVREELFANFAIAFQKHAAERVILVNHQDCGAYGSSSAFAGRDDELAKQTAQLTQAVETLGQRAPDKRIEAYLALISE